MITGLYYDNYLWLQFIMTGLYDRSLWWQVFMMTGLYDKALLWHVLIVKTGLNGEDKYLLICLNDRSL